mgnify:CR=1 FL=1
MKQGISAVIYKQKFKVMSQGRIPKKLYFFTRKIASKID